MQARGSRDSHHSSETLAGESSSRQVIAKQWHEVVTVLFADIVSYTAMSQELEAEQVMDLLHGLFSKYDSASDNWGVYKVETIGDCYMAATNLTTSNAQHVDIMVRFAIEMVQAANSIMNPLTQQPLSVRVGIHTGRVMSGIVGQHRSRYCLFGDTVNTSSRMESTGLPNQVQISEAAHQQLTSAGLRKMFVPRGEVDVKGKGTMRTYILDVHKADLDIPDAVLSL
jgi:class 3 adenylate cyclase